MIKLRKYRWTEWEVYDTETNEIIYKDSWEDNFKQEIKDKMKKYVLEEYKNAKNKI